MASILDTHEVGNSVEHTQIIQIHSRLKRGDPYKTRDWPIYNVFLAGDGDDLVWIFFAQTFIPVTEERSGITVFACYSMSE